MSPPPPDAAAVAARMNEFPGSFSPMLVKELRQGMRTNLFAVAFLLFQTVMILSLLAGLADPGSGAGDGFFWFFVVVILLVVQPLRGFNALCSEQSLNTMDLIQLTRLDAWRITLGKWTALNAQTLLFLTGVLPYLAMRYFLGNVNFVADLVALLFIGLGSALASAITVGCSAIRLFVIRGILVLAFAFGFTTLFFALQMTIFRTGGVGPQLPKVALATLAMAYGCFFFLSFGASRIAPLSENHSTRKRLFALACAALCGAFFWLGVDNTAVLTVVGLVLGFACVDALTEPLPVFSRVLEPFRKSPLRRFAAFLLAPGWLSGLGFLLLCALLWGLALGHVQAGASNPMAPATFAIVALSSANLLLLPLLFIHLLFPKHASDSHTFGIYTFAQACIALVTSMGMTFLNIVSRYEELVPLCLPLPSILLATVGNRSHLDYLDYLLAEAVLTLLLSLAVPLVRQRGALREFLRHLKPA
jgi:hypothetical protein